VLELALRTGRAPAVTYCGCDPNYGANTVIAHMVNLVYRDAEWACILDNNFIDSFLWMPRAEFDARWTGVKTNGQPYRIGGQAVGGGWTIVFLDSPPPPYSAKPQAEAFEPTQCPNGRCPLPMQPSLPLAPQPNFTGDVPPVGSPPTADHYWGRFADGQWGWLLKDRKVQQKPEQVAAEYPDGGVDFGRLSRQQSYSISGQPCPKAIGMQALVAGGGLTDDSRKWNLSVVGDAAFRAKVKEHIEKLTVEQQAKFHVKYYATTDWQVSQFKIPSGVSLRKPAVDRIGEQVGAVAVGDYTLEQLLNLLKIIDGILNPPQPQPQPQPQPLPQPQPQPQPVPVPTPDQPAAPSNWSLVILAAIVAVILYLRKKESK
jgi:hypothetical protein